MKKFRVLSDLHLDINEKYPLKISSRGKNKDIFTIVCGDIAGETDIGIDWLRKNIKCGIVVSGNHMPYNNSKLTMQELREKLSKEFPIDSNLTYLDVECGFFSKEIDGILFIGTCMYSDMKISDYGNSNGDYTLNCMSSHRRMNDYKFGILKKEYYFGKDNEPTYVRITPGNYAEWFNNSFKAIDEVITKNEREKNPLPIVLITHYPLVKKILENSFYVDKDNFASYGSDKEDWIQKHNSIKCYCCGHAHDVAKDFRAFKIQHNDGSHCIVINNARGYVSRCHDFNFNPNRFVNTQTWEIEEEKESKKVLEEKKKRYEKTLAMMSLFI